MAHLSLDGDTSSLGHLTFLSSNDVQTKAGWRKFTGGFFIGALGGSGVAYLLLSQIK